MSDNETDDERLQAEALHYATPRAQFADFMESALNGNGPSRLTISDPEAVRAAELGRQILGLQPTDEGEQ